MIHKNYLTFLIFEDKDSISAKCTTKILSLNLAYTFFLTGLFNTSTGSFICIPDPDFSYQRTYRPYLLLLF